MISTGKSRIFTGQIRGLLRCFDMVKSFFGSFSTGTTATEVYSFVCSSSVSIFQRVFFLSFGKFHKGEEDFFDAAIRHEIERRESEEWDGLLRGFALVLIVGGFVSIFFGILPTWKFLLGFFGAVGTLTILLAVVIAAAWILWGKR